MNKTQDFQGNTYTGDTASLFILAGDGTEGGTATTETSPEADQTPQKIKIGENEYTVEQIKEFAQAGLNEQKWKNTLAKKGEELNKEMEALKGWLQIKGTYETDPRFSEDFDKFLADRNKAQEDSSAEEIKADEIDDPTIKILVQQVATQGKQIAHLVEALDTKEKKDLDALIAEDKSKVIKEITNDAFTIEDVEEVIEESGFALTYTAAANQLRGIKLPEYKEKLKKEVEAELAKKYQNSAPPTAPIRGAGVVGQEKEFKDFDDAAEEIKKKYGSKLWK